EALESALAQDWPADRLEIIVVDDGSTDGTAAVVERIAARDSARPPRIRLIRQANAGACGATNTAFAAARRELIALLHPDDPPAPQPADPPGHGGRVGGDEHGVRRRPRRADRAAGRGRRLARRQAARAGRGAGRAPGGRPGLRRHAGRRRAGPGAARVVPGGPA